VSAPEGFFVAMMIRRRDRLLSDSMPNLPRRADVAASTPRGEPILGWRITGLEGAFEMGRDKLRAYEANQANLREAALARAEALVAEGRFDDAERVILEQDRSGQGPVMLAKLFERRLEQLVCAGALELERRGVSLGTSCRGPTLLECAAELGGVATHGAFEARDSNAAWNSRSRADGPFEPKTWAPVWRALAGFSSRLISCTRVESTQQVLSSPPRSSSLQPAF
jgi:hypothetical protein